ncbi:MAG: hypothetical protein D3903_15175, partial [Candidatus Electrothrix sp. GM3_4]|nr:hypothetical protein [Candidatus Electrothrix sp. GM3_4]
ICCPAGKFYEKWLQENQRYPFCWVYMLSAWQFRLGVGADLCVCPVFRKQFKGGHRGPPLQNMYGGTFRANTRLAPTGGLATLTA